ncbi:MAG: hypothetical protein ICV84_20745, partial [Flavisolibacter sp.]|nr:hypothetical protein [Flavisolibacter sp.]
MERIFRGSGDFEEETGYSYFKNKKVTEEFSLQFGEEITVVYNENFQHTITCSGKEITAYQLTKALHQLAPAQLPDFDASVAAFHHMQLLSLNLLLKGAVVPQLFINGQNDFLIRWSPAMLDKNVRGLLQQAEDNL